MTWPAVTRSIALRGQSLHQPEVVAAGEGGVASYRQTPQTPHPCWPPWGICCCPWWCLGAYMSGRGGDGAERPLEQSSTIASNPAAGAIVQLNSEPGAPC